MRIRRSFHHGFSLIEVLLAILILGIGVISIAALFPAGIAQQRLSTDDFMAPMVANHAMGIIRSRVSADDFGTFEEFWPTEWSINSNNHPGAADVTRTLLGDWGWMRPSYLLDDHPSSPFREAGTIDIFSRWRVDQENNAFANVNSIDVATERWDGWPMSVGNVTVPQNQRRLYGIPFSRQKHTGDSRPFAEDAEIPQPPGVFISQQERYYPMQSQLVQASVDPPRPQYVWECMFRRHHGRIYVAIFVYRVSIPGTAGATHFVVQRNQSNPTVPPLPIAIDLMNPPSGWSTEPWDVEYDTNDRPLAEVRGFPQNTFDVYAEPQGWQAQRQWILDQNNHVHRVIANRRPGPGDSGSEMVIELSRPLVPVRLPFGGHPDPYQKTWNVVNDGWPTYVVDEYYEDTSLGPKNPALTTPDERNAWFPMFDRGVVTRFWYIPLRMDVGGGIEYSLTPVYITVKEL